MIVPIVPYAIRGATWYQGESNAGRAYQYQTLLPTMIKCWRQAWGEPDLGFYIVQLAPFQAINPDQHESAWAELREAQRLTTLRVPNTGLAVITDVGEEKDIHPKRKEPVGARLALAALGVTYHQKIVASGPTYDSMQIQGNQIVLKFKNVGGGLVAQNGDLTGFAIAGADHKFYTAQAQIKGNTVIVSSPEVAKPVAVRFGWADFPVVNLYNKEGLPASPFKTDDFQWVTQPH
jgi:sialate O-acetylesterase